MVVSTYRLTTKTGKHIRIASKVTLDDGREIKFVDKMSKKDAIKNAMYQIERGI